MLQEEDMPPMCQPLNYCEAAAFRFKLPRCNEGENNEYIAFILPRTKKSDTYVKQNEMQQLHNDEKKKCYPETETIKKNESHHESTICTNKWSTEYRSTIDECAKSLMNSKQICKREPIYPQNYFCNKMEKSSCEQIKRKEQDPLIFTRLGGRKNSLQMEKRYLKKPIKRMSSSKSSDSTSTIIPKQTRSSENEMKYPCSELRNRPMWKCKLTEEVQSSNRTSQQQKCPLQCCEISDRNFTQKPETNN